MPVQHVLKTRHQARESYIELMDMAKAAKKPEQVVAQTMRYLCLHDLYFLLSQILSCAHLFSNPAFNQDWLYERVREVELNPNGYIDIWFREGFKSTISTFGLNIQDVLFDPEITIGIFAFNRPIAKSFLRPIKREFEDNDVLKNLFPDILWDKPEQQSPKWSLAIDTPIMTTTGWKPHGALQPGDKIFGLQGQIISVVGNSGTMLDVPCRRIVFDDCEMVASSEHLWPVFQRGTTSGTWPQAPQKKIVATNNLPIGDKTQRLPCTPAIEMPSTSLELDPYILGLWLGDGTAGTNIISMHSDDEEEVLSQIRSAGFTPYIHRRKPEDNFSMYGVEGLKEILEEVGCLYEKYIPDSYLLGNKKDRLSLLQGLMDSDGTCKKNGPSRTAGMCMFSNTNKDLADGVFYLATSLGLRPSILNFMPKSVGNKRIYHVYFVGVQNIPPFRSNRKLANCKEKRTKVGRYVRSITEIDSVPVNCIKVDADDHLYLAGRSMVPTHNSEDDGIIVKRKGNPKESTIEAWGLVESMPTGRHFNIRDYDDIITEKYVTNEEQVRGATEAWELSLNLGSAVPVRRYGRSNIARYKGTRYALNDPYAEIMRRKTAIPRVYPATHDGTAEGKPVLWSEELLAEKRRDMGPHTFASQLLCNPAADKVQGFDEQWLRYWNPDNFRNMNLYILVDPANAKGKKNDYTTMGVIALGEDQNYRLIDGIRSRLNLTERTDKLFKLHQKYRPMAVGYEEYGMQADKQHIEYEMGLRNYDFKKSLIGLGGNVPKVERIRRLIPVMEQGRFFIPERCFFIDNEQHQQDFSMQIKTEMGEFPVGTHDDILDMLARVLEEKLNAKFPIPGQGGNGGYHGREQTHTDSSSPHYGFKGGNQDGNFVPNHARMIELDENGFFVRGRKPEQTSTDRQSFHNAAWRK